MPIFEPKHCFFCQKKMRFIDYKNASLMHDNLDYFNRIKRREHTGTCLRHQKMLSTAVKRARHLALAGFVR
jgi:small subunit ribosomal protein S18